MRNSHIPHTIEYAAMYGFEAIAHIRERTAHDDAHRIVDVGRFHLVLNVHMLNLVCVLYHLYS